MNSKLNSVKAKCLVGSVGIAFSLVPMVVSADYLEDTIWSYMDPDWYNQWEQCGHEFNCIDYYWQERVSYYNGLFDEASAFMTENGCNFNPTPEVNNQPNSLCEEAAFSYGVWWWCRHMSSEMVEGGGGW